MNENRIELGNLGIAVDKIRGNSGKVVCPQCSHTRKKKTDPCLSVNIQEGIYKCHNCQWSGGVAKKQEYQYEPKREYVRPVFVNTTQCSEKTVNFFFKRGISQRTLNDAKVTESDEWMPGCDPGQKVKAINFNYFRDNELINTKFRDGKKNFKLSKNAELIFYGLDNIKKSDTVICVEGEFDALSYWEVGIKECVSVPNGASLGKTPNLEYLDSSVDYFSSKKKIILATDNDEAGIKLRDELVRRLGAHRCYKVDFKDCKDANEYLQKYGPEALKETVSDKNIKPFPISGVVDIDEAFAEYDFILKNGGLKRGLTIGIEAIDNLISWEKSQLTVITGIPNHGKSPMSLQIQILLSIKYGWKWGMFTPEHYPLGNFLIKVVEMISGKMSRTGKITSNEQAIAKQFIKDHFFFIRPEKDNKLDSILSIARSLVFRNGINGLIIDPWNKLEYEQPAGMSETNFVSQQLDKIITFDQECGVHTIIVAHPTKAKKNGLSESAKFVVPELSDIAGSANWFNKIDNGIVFYRDFVENVNKFYVKKIKSEHLGHQGMATLKYNVNNSRFSSLSAPHDNSNWLIPDAKQNDLFEPEPPVNFVDSEKELEEEEVPF